MKTAQTIPLPDTELNTMEVGHQVQLNAGILNFKAR